MRGDWGYYLSHWPPERYMKEALSWRAFQIISLAAIFKSTKKWHPLLLGFIAS
jgi:hypothetical protein